MSCTVKYFFRNLDIDKRWTQLMVFQIFLAANYIPKERYF